MNKNLSRVDRRTAARIVAHMSSQTGLPQSELCSLIPTDPVVRALSASPTEVLAQIAKAAELSKQEVVEGLERHAERIAQMLRNDHREPAAGKAPLSAGSEGGRTLARTMFGAGRVRGIRALRSKGWSDDDIRAALADFIGATGTSRDVECAFRAADTSR